MSEKISIYVDLNQQNNGRKYDEEKVLKHLEDTEKIIRQKHICGEIQHGGDFNMCFDLEDTNTTSDDFNHEAFDI